MSDLPTPDTRTEVYLARAAGADVTIPQQPQTRAEVYLEAIAEGGTSIEVVQTTGNSEEAVMSQKATTDMLAATHTVSAAVQALVPSLLQSFIAATAEHPGEWVRVIASYVLSTNPDEYAAIKGLVNAVYDDFTTHAKCFIEVLTTVLAVDSALPTSGGKLIASTICPFGLSTYGFLSAEWDSSTANLAVRGFIPANA